MAAKITTLIDKVDNVELIRDEIAAILALESAGQVALADASPSDSKLWKLRVFTERSNPWDMWTHKDDAGNPPDVSPIVNVTFDTENFDESRSDAVERQCAVATYNIEIYGYGISEQTSNQGQIPGDSAAKFEAMRAARLVRNILTSAQYTYLGHQGLVWKRRIASLTSFPEQKKERHVDHISAVQIALEVTFNEFSPQYQGNAIELISAQLTRDTTTGQLLAAYTEDLTTL